MLNMLTNTLHTSTQCHIHWVYLLWMSPLGKCFTQCNNNVWDCIHNEWPLWEHKDAILMCWHNSLSVVSGYYCSSCSVIEGYRRALVVNGEHVHLFSITTYYMGSYFSMAWLNTCFYRRIKSQLVQALWSYYDLERNNKI